MFEDLANLTIGQWEIIAVATALVVLVIRDSCKKRFWPARDEIRYERLGTNDNRDPIDSQWVHREHEMNARQMKLDASQDVMTRLV